MPFKIQSPYRPTGDQPEAIKEICEAVNAGADAVTLLGVTGSGKTFTMANVIERLQRPALILSHNKTLAAQLYGEFKSFFPDNAVEYFVSYYDYYQPEAYLPVTDTYIEKDLSINDEIEKLRLSASSALLSGRRDVIVISSVSCLYGIGNPQDFHDNTIVLRTGMRISRNKLLYRLVDALYTRSDVEFKRGSFRVKGDTIDIYLAYSDTGCRIVFFGDTIEELELIDPLTGMTIEEPEEVTIYPANIFVTTKERTAQAIRMIQDDMVQQCEYFSSIGKQHEANRLKKRVEYDMEMIKELGYCPGIENYSRYFDGRSAGQRPFCLIDYFPKDFITFIDESHVTLPQVRAMYGGDRSRKEVLIEYGFRLPAAADNRPLKFDEFENILGQRVFVSATPGDYELEKSEGLIVEQVVRPTGLLDPPIEVRPSKNQIDDLMEEIELRTEKDERVLVTTLTKRMAGVNLLREGLDLPDVSLVAIIDADKEGFLRSDRALTQIAGRAARNLNGLVIMYADTITGSMRKTIDETNRRRAKQAEYNERNHITPTQVRNDRKNSLAAINGAYKEPDEEENIRYVAEDPVISKMSPKQLLEAVEAAKKKMEEAAKALDFPAAAKYRDEMYELMKLRK